MRTGYTKPKTKFRYEFPDLSVRKTASTTNKVGNGLAKKYGTYTGDELLGIGTLHKSNAVPIRKDSNDAIDSSKHEAIMRKHRIFSAKYQLSKQLGGKEVLQQYLACIMLKYTMINLVYGKELHF